MSEIELVGVSKRYGRVHALDGVDLSVGRGVTGLLGPNGAGKTTLLRILATVLASDAGSMELLGHDPTDAEQRTAIRGQLGYMPQEPGFYGNFTAFEFLDYVAILKQLTDRRKRHDEVRAVLGMVDLVAEARHKVRDLSGGMRRRLALAQALLDRPDLLLLDEPTSGLDPAQRLRFRELVSQLPNRPVVLLSTHQTEDIAAVCERVVVIAAGRVRFDGAPDEMRQVALDRVWTSDSPSQQAIVSWRSGNGLLRHVGEPPPNANLVEPTIDDAYLLLSGAPGGTA